MLKDDSPACKRCEPRAGPERISVDAQAPCSNGVEDQQQHIGRLPFRYPQPREAGPRQQISARSHDHDTGSQRRGHPLAGLHEKAMHRPGFSQQGRQSKSRT